MSTSQPRTPSLRSNSHLRMEALCKGRASHELVFERDDFDQFSLTVLPRDGDVTPLAAEDLLIATPLGGHWDPATTSVCYYAIPLQAGGEDWVSVGIEQIVPHETRKAYPVSRGYLYSLDRELDAFVLTLGRLAAELSAVDAPQGNQPLDRRRLSRQVVRQLDRPDIDAEMLAVTADYYRHGDRCFLRTELLAPSLHPLEVADALASFGATASMISTTYLVGVRPSDERQTGMVAQVERVMGILRTYFGVGGWSANTGRRRDPLVAEGETGGVVPTIASNDSAPHSDA